MPTHITQIDDPDSGTSILRVDGEMHLEDALLLEKIALGIRSDIDQVVKLDLADLDFLDSDGAEVLRRLVDEHGFIIEGMETFLQTAVDQVEREN